ncbi:hypothetical protein O181_011364 [Austropuccinia psidii MF-1]|uniref:Uncharacterized protein n=1 Tax=Austropuccinia psidii MF-1 TaxID=1389203 RepID=A0A9Q3BUB6_9BASI|nr:hypothetical protein [Austropuccinia psidii MF-1]
MRRDSAKIINEPFPTNSQCPPLTRNIHLVVLRRFLHMMRITSLLLKSPELDITALSDHQIKGEALEHLQQIISETIIPSSWTRVPHNMGSPSHGSLKAAEWALLYKVYIPFLMLSQQISLDAHQSANTQRRMGQSEELANELTKNTFHLICAINIATSSTVSIDDATACVEHWKKFRLSKQHLFPKQISKPNHHFADHIPELLQC